MLICQEHNTIPPQWHRYTGYKNHPGPRHLQQSFNSVAKIPYIGCCQDGVSNTFSIVPSALGHSKEEQVDNLVNVLDGYFSQGAFHLNVNVLNREMLIDAMNNPGKYPTLTIRVSGYAVLFDKLSKAHQEEVISRTFHEKLGC